jgi:hypothetical protein
MPMSWVARALEMDETRGFMKVVVDVAPAAYDLQGDGPLRVLLLGLVDDPHAALADLPDDAVVADPLGRTRRRS